jgi:hypothetical protein
MFAVLAHYLVAAGVARRAAAVGNEALELDSLLLCNRFRRMIFAIRLFFP